MREEGRSLRQVLLNSHWNEEKQLLKCIDPGRKQASRWRHGKHKSPVAGIGFAGLRNRKACLVGT